MLGRDIPIKEPSVNLQVEADHCNYQNTSSRTCCSCSGHIVFGIASSILLGVAACGILTHDSRGDSSSGPPKSSHQDPALAFGPAALPALEPGSFLVEVMHGRYHSQHTGVTVPRATVMNAGKVPNARYIPNLRKATPLTATLDEAAESRNTPRRAVLLHALPLAAACWPSCSSAARLGVTPPSLMPAQVPLPPGVDPLFSRLHNHYYLLRPGQTTSEAAGIVDSNPVNKLNTGLGLTAEGFAQVEASAAALEALGVVPIIFYDSGARASQTADLLAKRLGVPRADIVPEFRWLEARGLGVLEGSALVPARARIRSLDALDIDNRPETTDDGTPNESVRDVFCRMRNTIAKIENSYGGGDFVIVAGDATVLSILAAAAAGADLRQHARFELRPGEFWDLDQLVRDYKAGNFREREQPAPPSEEGLARERDAVKEMGPKPFPA